MEPADETRAYLEFLLPQSLAPQLPGFLRELESRSGELGITDMQLSLTSLEEVFLTIARQVCTLDISCCPYGPWWNRKRNACAAYALVY